MKSSTNSYIFYPDNQALGRAIAFSAMPDVDGAVAEETAHPSVASRSADYDPLQKYILGNFEHSKHGRAVLNSARARLEAAVTDELRQRAPEQWAETQDHLGILLATLGQSRGDVSLLEQAVQAFESALEERHLDNSPLDWAATQTNLGMALQALGQQRQDTKSFKRSVEAFTSAVEQWPRQQAPQEWALAMHHLGTTFYLQGKLLKGNRPFQKSVVAYNNALAEFNADRDPLEYAISLANRGTVLQSLGESEQNADRVEEALGSSLQMALTVMLEQQLPMHLAVMTRINIAAARNLLAEMTNGGAAAQEAADELEVIVAACGDACHHDCIQQAEALLSEAEELVAKLG